MESLEHIQETTLSGNGLYEVIEVESTEVLEPEVVRLKEELATERERGLGMLAEFDNYHGARGRNAPARNRPANARSFSRFST